MKQTLDTTLCEWCFTNTPATTTATLFDNHPRPEIRANLCNTHANEAASDFLAVNLYPLANKPEYSILETEPYPMTGEWTVAQLELGARYGVPYPVCGDLTTRKRVGKSWTGHDPNGTQY